MRDREISDNLKYPVTTYKGVADLCLYELQCNVQTHVHTGIKIFLLCSYR